jgi:hypothetical protein
MNKPVHHPTYRDTHELISAIVSSGKAPAEYARAYALGMVWSMLTPEQQSGLIESAKA